MEERYNIQFIVLILQKQEFREFMECLDMRKLNENEKKLITLLLSKSNLTFNMPNDLSNMDVVDLDDGGMGSIEFFRKESDREFGTAILNAVAYDIDDRKIMIEISIDSENFLYQLDAFTEDFLPLKADLGANIKINDFHSPPIYE